MRSLSFELGEWRVDPDTNEMARGGVVVRIEPKAMDVLVVLARHDGDVVTRDELLATVWAGVIVGDEALSQAVIKLRRALGDDPRAPRYIETIPKRGYRLTAAVSKVHARKSLALRPRAIALTFVVMLAIGALVAWRGYADPQEGARGMPRSADASRYFVEGQQKLLVRRMTENGEARTLFRKAIEADPAFARAYAGLAMTYALESRLGGKDASLRALQLAETARLIDPDLPDVYWVMGFVQVQSRNHEAAIASLRRAMELDGSFADAYALLGGIYTYVGQPQRSVPLLRNNVPKLASGEL